METEIRGGTREREVPEVDLFICWIGLEKRFSFSLGLETVFFLSWKYGGKLRDHSALATSIVFFFSLFHLRRGVFGVDPAV